MAEQESYLRVDRYLEQRENIDAMQALADQLIARWSAWKDEIERRRRRDELVTATRTYLRENFKLAPPVEDGEAMTAWWQTVMEYENFIMQLTNHVGANHKNLCQFIQSYRREITSLEAEDLIQEGFARAFTQIRDGERQGLPFQEIKNIDGWFKTIMRRWALSKRRKEFGTGKGSGRVLTSFELLTDPESHMDGQEPPPERLIIENETRKKLDHLLSTLGTKTRTTIQLYLDGLSPKEIAGELHQKQETIDSKIMRGRAQLRRAYWKEYPEEKESLEKQMLNAIPEEEERKIFARYLFEGMDYSTIGKELVPRRKGEAVKAIVVKCRRRIGVIP